MLKVSLLSEVQVFPHSRESAIPRFTSFFEYLHPNHSSMVLSFISLSHCSVDQTFYYQNKSCCISKPDYKVYLFYNGKSDKMLSQETDECWLVLYVGQFQVAYFFALH